MPSFTTNAAFWTAFVTLGGALVAGAAIWAMILANRESNSKDKALTEFQAKAQADIASANARAEEAKADGQALKLQIAQANERAAAATEETAKLNVIAEQERLARIRLESKLLPRRITARQKTAMKEILGGRAPGPITIISRMMDGEGADFAHDIGGVFSECLWTVEYNASALVSFQGLSFAVVGDGNWISEIESAVLALEAAGYPATRQQMESSQIGGKRQEGVAVIVGRR